MQDLGVDRTYGSNFGNELLENREHLGSLFEEIYQTTIGKQSIKRN